MRKMRDLNQISFEEFSGIMLWLNTSEKESPEKFTSFLFDICRKCRLAGEMIDVLHKLENKFTDEHLSLAMEGGGPQRLDHLRGELSYSQKLKKL